jgi:hypothetical protein
MTLTQKNINYIMEAKEQFKLIQIKFLFMEEN